jgi:hypothetical protein
MPEPPCRRSRCAHGYPEKAVRSGKTVQRVLKYDEQVEREMIVTRLIFLYSYFVPPPDPARHRNSQQASMPGSEHNSRQSMYWLRQLAYALANCVRCVNKGRKVFRVKLNPWQEHLLLHYEMLEPFLSYMGGEGEVYSFLWGEDWKQLELRKARSWRDLAVLAKWARELGSPFVEILYFLRGPQKGTICAEEVRSAETAFKVNAERILKMTGCNQETCLILRTVKMHRFPFSDRPRDPTHFAFIDHLTSVGAAAIGSADNASALGWRPRRRRVLDIPHIPHSMRRILAAKAFVTRYRTG